MRLKDERERLEKERAEREKFLQPNEPDENETMMAMMGFSNFDTTQVCSSHFSRNFCTMYGIYSTGMAFSFQLYITKVIC